MYDAMSGNLPDRVPVAPKIWIDLSAIITNTSFEECIQDPETSLRVIAQAGIITGVDAVRQFHTPAKKTKKIDGKLFEITDKGEIAGEIDLNGGFQDTSCRCFFLFYRKILFRRRILTTTRHPLQKSRIYRMQEGL